MLNEYDIAVLKLCADISQDRIHGWGAALGVSIEYLYNSGYLDRVITDAGLTYITNEKGLEELAKALTIVT